MAKYILKRRTIGRSRAKNPFRPRGQTIYGAWETVSEHGRLTDAIAAQRQHTTWMVDFGVFHRGQRVTDNNCRVRYADSYYMTVLKEEGKTTW